MDYLIDFANSGLVREVAETALRSPLLQGVVLDIDPYWLLTWRLFTISPAMLDSRERYYGDWLFLNANETEIESDWLAPAEYDLFPQPIRLDDLKQWRPHNWLRYSEVFRFRPDQPPFVVKLYLRPAESSNEEVD